jgi:2-polyprenyl-3-methyl-5-hydroxy-6-metoxy-1,4-benzoquinol methylase
MPLRRQGETMTAGNMNALGWAEEYRQATENSRQLSYPTETLVRLFKGDYVPGMPKAFEGLRLCDVSCGIGNNAFFFCDLGLTVFATEIHEEICAQVRRSAEASGRAIEVRIGTNRNLPFEDDFFDFLVSWNVLHYENTEADIRQGIAEYARVLRPGGRLFISTTGPEHKILTGAITVAPHIYEIRRDDDFRKGERFFYFDAPNYIHHYFDPVFTDVQVGRIQDNLFTETLDWWLVTARKPV